MTPIESGMIAAILAFVELASGGRRCAQAGGQEIPGIRNFGRVTEAVLRRWPASPDWLHCAARVGREFSSISALNAEKWRTEKRQVESLGKKYI